MQRRIYADNAATSFPKPPEVWAAMADFGQRVGASAGRGVYREALEAGEVVDTCRRRIAALLNAPDPRQIVFGLNCSHALNLVLRGWPNPGDHVVTTRFEHNSILRPLHDLARAGVETTFLPVDPADGGVDPAAVRDALRPNTALVALQHASNVTGIVQPIVEVARIVGERGIALLIDAAQTAGHVPIDVQALGVDFLAFPGHKGLLGPLGTGGLYIRPGREDRLRPLIAGGTGSVSESPQQPDFLPDKFESGSQNAIGLAGLSAGVDWLLRRGVEAVAAHERSVCEQFVNVLAEVEGLTLVGPRRAQERVAVFSILVEGYEPAELAAVLEGEFGILCRAGLHCAPWAHEGLGTRDSGGTLRLSFGPFTTPEDTAACAAALQEVSTSAARAGR